MMKLGSIGLQVLKDFEKYIPHAYDDADPQARPITNRNQIKGRLTIGYGFTKGVKIGDTMTVEEAEERLKHEVQLYEAAVNKYVTVDLNQNQFDALVLFSYNVGIAAFQSSTLLKCLNKQDRDGVEHQWMRWVWDNGVKLKGLERRRRAELELFRSPVPAQ